MTSKNDDKVGLETRWRDLEDLIEEKKPTMPLYAEVSQMEILTAFEDLIKELEREDLSIKK